MSPSITRQLDGAHGVAEVIARMDSPVVYGMPGGHMMLVYDALRDHQDSVECVLVREESLGSVMAEAHGRLTGRPAVVMGQGAWVFGNASIGVTEAHLGASPMVILIDASEGGSFSHHGPYQSGNGGYGAYDLPQAMSTITKRTFVAYDPVQAVQMTQLAVKHATEGEPGPVAVVFHSASLMQAITGEDLHRIHLDGNYTSPVPTASDSSVDLAAAAVRKSTTPVLVAGNGCRRSSARSALLEFAERLDIPVATSTSGKGVFPEDSARAAGVIGSFGHDTANALVGSADLVVAVGTKLGATDTLEENPKLIDPSRQTIVQIDIEALNIGWTTPTDVGVLGSMADVLPRLVDVVAPSGFTGLGAERVAQARAADGYFTEIPANEPADQLVNPRRLARILGEELPDDAVVACDAGENRIFMLHDFMVRNCTFLAPNGCGGMGYAIPAATAATYASPETHAVAVTGDGGFGMTMHGLMTAVENRRRLLVVVMDNQALGWVHHGQGDRPFLAGFASFDLAEISRAFGCAATTARSEDEVRKGVRAGLEDDGVHVLVVKTDLVESYKSIETKLAGKNLEEVG